MDEAANTGQTSPTMSGPLCGVRLALSSVVVYAVAQAYRSRADYDAARKRNDPDQCRYFYYLEAACANEREARRNLREHIREHRC
jgi:hypothetical protein